jgi:hypothetical protein
MNIAFDKVVISAAENVELVSIIGRQSSSKFEQIRLRALRMSPQISLLRYNYFKS